jgi:hypothetical protein
VCQVFPKSGDSRLSFNHCNAAIIDTGTVPTIVFTTVLDLPTVTLNGLTEGAQVQVDWMQQITLTWISCCACASAH